MKKIIRIFICCFLLNVFITNTAFGYTYNSEYVPPITVKSELLPPSENSSTAHVQTVLRGNFFAAGDLTIIDKGGKIGVAAKAFMSQPVDSLYMTIYLDRQINGKWTQVAFYDFEFHSEDYPNGMLTPGVDFTILGQPTGYYYRLRGSYVAFLNGANEGFGPVTHGILIE